VTKSEIAKLFGLIASLYPRDNAFVSASDATVIAWYKILADMPYDLAESALQRHASLSPFPPSIAEIRSGAIKPALPPDVAYGLVMDAIKQHGYYHAKAAKESLPPEVWAVVERMGWESLCMSETPEVGRGQFLKLTRFNPNEIRNALRYPPV
jgi:hypothetical protein